MALPAHRLDRQLISRPRFATPAEVVAWFGAMQAQDYLAALWALGLRTPRATEPAMEAALGEGRIVRTHLFRGTWQYVARDDVPWMLDLMGPRIIASWAGRLRELELDQRTLGRCGELFVRALTGGEPLTRAELAAVLGRGRIRAANSRLAHILGHAELSGVIAGAGRRGKQQTWVLLDGRAPASRRRTRDEGLAEVAVRYFQSRGPATVQDLAWWTGLPLGGAREALELGKSALVSQRVDGVTYWMVEGKAASRRSPSAHLLPAFDEYLVAYKDRSAVLDPAHVKKVNAGGGMLSPAVVVDGRVAGTWRRALGDEVTVAVRPFGRLTRRERDAIETAAERYGKFLGVRARVSIPA